MRRGPAIACQRRRVLRHQADLDEQLVAGTGFEVQGEVRALRVDRIGRAREPDRRLAQPAIEAAFRLLATTGASVGGVVLTQVDMKQQAKYGYGDPGYYYAEYKKYYVS